MGEQQSQKQGMRSSAQKEDRAREGYGSMPASNPVAGAFGQGEASTNDDPTFNNDDEVAAAKQPRPRRDTL